MQKSMWWYFLLAFGLVIGAIQLLGCWARPASAQSEFSASPPPAAAQRHSQVQPTHWRDLLLQR